jgi:hypothetical protein
VPIGRLVKSLGSSSWATALKLSIKLTQTVVTRYFTEKCKLLNSLNLTTN